MQHVKDDLFKLLCIQFLGLGKENNDENLGVLVRAASIDHFN